MWNSKEDEHMTSRERVSSTINHIQPYRVPIDFRFGQELLNKLKLELQMNENELWEWIGQDVFTIRPEFRNSASDIFYADPTITVNENGYYIDMYHVPFRQVKNDFQTYIEAVNQPPLKDINTVEEIDNFPWPDTKAWDYSNIYNKIIEKKDKAVWSRSRGCFQTAQLMRGMDTFLIDLALNPEYACCIMDHIMKFVMDDARCTLEAAKGEYTFVEYNDDIASQRGLLISPDMWREYVKPRMAKFCELVHSYGAKVKYHSCGSIYAIIPDLIKIGVDILNPIQPLAANMDPFKLKEEFGNELCFHGAIDIQELLPKASKHEVKEYVQRIIDIVGKDGGYILAGSHTIQADAKVENIVTMIETANSICGGPQS